MKNLSFAEKNNFIVKYKSGNCFSKDLELFKKHFPIHKLNNELARANSFTYDRLDGQMLYALLEKISTEEILKNREESESTQENLPEENLKVLEERIVDLEEKNDVNENEISYLRDELENKDTSIEELQKKTEALEKKAFNKKKVNKKNSPQ